MSSTTPRLSLQALQSPIAGPYSLDIHPGECLCIMGASGSGKSVLLRLIADLDPGTGDVLLNGQPRQRFTGPQWRSQVMYVPAEPAWWGASVMEHFPAGSEDALQVTAQQLGLRPQFMQTPVAQLSTGERQRLALLRALLRQPQVLLLDEPTAALDEAAVAAVEQLLRQHQQQGLALLWVTHSHAQAQRVAHRCMRLHDRQLSAIDVATEQVAA